jgi:competence protein ComEC
MKTPFIVALGLCLIGFPTLADVVVPSERVTNSVTIRAGESSNTDPIGSFSPGERLPWVQDRGRWRQVRMNANQTGWVSKSWTRRLPDTQPPDGTLPPREQDELRIHYLPVGAGTCTVVECPGPNASPMIIDCGAIGGRGPDDLDGDATVAAVNAILSNHSSSPNLVLSHADEDHYAYVDELLDQVQMSHIWLGGEPGEYPSTLRTLLDAQDANGATVHEGFDPNFHNDQAEMGDELSCGVASTFILTVNSGNSKNANSLVLSIQHGDFSAIFTGDAEASTERAAIDNYDGAVKATVLTGSHHGADTEGSNGSSKDVSVNNRSRWPAATVPEVVIYSHGRKFGHPRCTITENYRSSLETVPDHPMHCGNSTGDNVPAPLSTPDAEYSTETNGTITVTTDGTSPLSIRCGGVVGCAAEIEF